MRNPHRKRHSPNFTQDILEISVRGYRTPLTEPFQALMAQKSKRGKPNSNAARSMNKLFNRYFDAQ
jgi:hypothetical protein